jgi:hypothetical protein
MAISKAELALAITHEDHSDGAETVNSLGNMQSSRCEQTENMDDLSGNLESRYGVLCHARRPS